MGTMLYNNVELLDIKPILDTHDPEKRSMILHVPDDNTYFLAIYTIYDDTYVIDSKILCDTLWRYFLSSDGTKWTSSGGTTVDTELSVTNIIWSSHDLKNPDDTVYYQGSEPVSPDAPDNPDASDATGISADLFSVFMLGQRLRPGLLGLYRKNTDYTYDRRTNTLTIHNDGESLSYSFDEETLTATIKEV